eukprot:TRINITY_DN1672_c0_g1_i2.p1 TRINITY_DN1672_c0_g1~~TRINITY_DN1672_c0_g1_i2.p1  ORF type:complete len:699 (-),score=200.58 TRINITY_DN1672_c0_g1_i2:10-2106(-)
MKSLKDQLARVKESATVGQVRREAPGLFQRKMAYLMGNEANYALFVKRWTKIQAVGRGHMTRLLYKKRVRMQAFRTKVAQEVLDTENSYVKSLKTCIDIFLNPLRDPSVKKPLVDKLQIKTLFSDIEIIYGFNVKLKEDIEARFKSWSAGQRLGDIFSKVAGFLKVYTGYVQNFDAALKLYEQLKSKNKNFAQFAEEARMSTGGMDLPSFLIMPIQRIPRYAMLLQTLTKNTWPDHSDYKDLDAATAKIGEVATYLNERKRQFEQMQHLIVVQEMMTSHHHIDLVQPGRMFLGRYEVDEMKKGDRVFFLFSDILLFGHLIRDKKKQSETLDYKSHVGIDEVTIKQTQDPKLGAVFELVKRVDPNTALIKFTPNKTTPDAPQKLLADLQAAQKSLQEVKASRERRLSGNPDSPSSKNHDEDEEEEMTVEEQLRLKEEKKKLIKAQLEAAEKEAAAAKTSPSEGASSSSGASAASPSAPQRRVLRSAESLVHLKAIVEVQMEEVENAKQKKKKSSNPGELEATMAKLTKELAELDDQISEIVQNVSAEEADELKKKADAAKEDEKKTRRKSGKRKSIMQRLFGGKDKDDSNSLSPDGSDKKGSRRARGVSSPPGSIQPINPESGSSGSAPNSPSTKERDVRSSSPSAVRPSISISSASSDGSSSAASSPSASPTASPSSSSRRNSTPVKPAIVVSSDKGK